MADVFVSYASADRDRAAQLAGALGALGWSVWWDRKIIAGQAFDQAIERELESAKSVIVLWSNQSIGSEWVKNEAAAASERGVLVPATIESVKPPLEFRRKQTADLIDWNGEPSHSGFQALCEGVANTIGAAPLRQARPRQSQKWQWNNRGALAAILTIAIALGLSVYLISPSRIPTSTSIRQSNSSEAGAAAESKKTLSVAAGLADLVTGTYLGSVVSDSKGSSRSDIDVTVAKQDRYTVRVTSDYPRIGTVDVTLTRIGNKIFNAGGDSTLIVDLNQNPPSLAFNPRGELAYVGTKQK